MHLMYPNMVPEDQAVEQEVESEEDQEAMVLHQALAVSGEVSEVVLEAPQGQGLLKVIGKVRAKDHKAEQADTNTDNSDSLRLLTRHNFNNYYR